MADPSPGASVVDTLDLGKSFGVMLLSTIIVAALYGITFLQSLWYYERFPEDSWALKATVGAVWLLDTATIALNSHAIYYYLVINYNNPAAFANQVWSVQVELLVTYTVVLIVQIFFILRIYRLRPRAWYIPAFMGFIALVSYGLILAVVVGVFEHPSWNGVAAANPRIANWVFGMVVDTGITVVLCWYMWSEKVYVRRRCVMSIPLVTTIGSYTSACIGPTACSTGSLSSV
ncbi:hypothetical protein C2E23DRAFT_222533 [Lenzites betulinus]|nr:hypothetical protein C2E23DRAFT_222533 [Lenzites betulinus]